nr:protein tyrosine phosphatase domain-containing protein 1-like [Salvelinus alpinus]
MMMLLKVVVEEEVLEVPDLTAEVEKTVSQQAIQLLGKEMRGKGIPVPSPRQPCPRPETALSHTLHMERPLTPNLALLQEPSLLLETPLSPALAHDPVLSSDQELDPLWQRQNRVAASLLNPLHPGKRLLSYSDSALYKLDPRRDPDQEQNQVWSIPCCNPLTQHQLATAWEPPISPSLPPQHHPFSMGEQTREERRGGQDRSSKERYHQTQKNMSPLFQRRKQLCEGQRSLSFGFGGSLSKPSGEELSEGRPWRGDMPVMSLTGGEESVCGVDRAGDREDREDRERLTEVPVVTLYAELPMEARRLLVARALALGLNDEDLRYKVSVWQVRHDS